MGILKRIEERIQKWLFKEEIEEYITVQQEQYIQNKETTSLLEKETNEIKKSIEKEMLKCEAEDHTMPPTDSDIERYFCYHSNYINNMLLLEKNTGVWTNTKREIIPKEEYIRDAKKGGWIYLRTSCGLPFGDLNKPSSPWTLSDCDKQKSVKEGPEIHMKQK